MQMHNMQPYTLHLEMLVEFRARKDDTVYMLAVYKAIRLVVAA